MTLPTTETRMNHPHAKFEIDLTDGTAVGIGMNLVLHGATDGIVARAIPNARHLLRGMYYQRPCWGRILAHHVGPVRRSGTTRVSSPRWRGVIGFVRRQHPFGDQIPSVVLGLWLHRNIKV